MTETGTCSNTVLNCKAGYFCPAEDSTTVNCEPCSEDMVYGQSCYCQDSKYISNCQECAGNQCSKCVRNTFLSNNKCLDCPSNCDTCANNNSCITCSEGYEKNQNTGICEVSCKNEDGYQPIEVYLGEQSTQMALSRIANCILSDSDKICYFCSPQGYVTTVEGQCTKNCENIQNGNYCKDGVPTACVEGLTSQCTCGIAKNCESCDETGNKCKKCLPHIQVDSTGECGKCDDGYELHAKLCWLSEIKDPPAPPPVPVPGPVPVVVNKLGGGAIAGITIAVVIVVGVVCVGTFLFLKKKFYNVAVEIRNNLK
ncbi:Cysteine-rich membrane protein 2 [Spironucleus salmonicida]|uniref:Cysteine-rich membrane protein 2 n=1 Tax=Spironucleus salmonicida TaxID=348837 RepID=V6LD49_9EUKA|nr:Cysteine-rich membrane protein 2 [Spironucleus salmonicida]|eukprot:EST42425.1 Cysteine-rich membrane protein 2 [Spironucleus salmonicida]